MPHTSHSKGVCRKTVFLHIVPILKSFFFFGKAGENSGSTDLQRVDKTVLEDFIASEQERGLSVNLKLA
jgi:hypothetical protein